MLEVIPMEYPRSLLEEWKGGDHSFLISSNASKYIKKILTYKAIERPGERFFGEAYLASDLGPNTAEGWYNSYKWLTAEKWITGRSLEPKFERPFYEALETKIGIDVIRDLQDRTVSFYEEIKGQLGFKKPVAPDLWLIDRNGNFMFIESKMEGDQTKPHQLAGLALINKYIKSSVSIRWLYQEGRTPPNRKVMREYIDKFSLMYRSI